MEIVLVEEFLYTWISSIYFAKIYRSFATGRFFKTIGENHKAHIDRQIRFQFWEEGNIR